MTSIPDALPAPSGTLDERGMLEGFLEQYRAIVVRKVSGLTDEQAREVLVNSGTSIAGLVRHLRWVEEAWFVETLSGGKRPAWRDESPDWQFGAGDESLADLVAVYVDACERSRAIAHRYQLDDVGTHPRMGEVSLRWIYLHMIEEIARHAGHLDIIREQLDGASGFD